MDRALKWAAVLIWILLLQFFLFWGEWMTTALVTGDIPFTKPSLISSLFVGVIALGLCLYMQFDALGNTREGRRKRIRVFALALFAEFGILGGFAFVFAMKFS